MLLAQAWGQTKRSKRYSQLLGYLGGGLSALRHRLKLRFSFLLFLLSCYIVVNRVGPFVSKAGDLAIENFEVERRIVENFDDEALRVFRGAFDKFRVVTRVPYPVLWFGRASQDNTVSVTMGNSRSKNRPQETTSTTVTTPPEQVGEQKNTTPLQEGGDVGATKIEDKPVSVATEPDQSLRVSPLPSKRLGELQKESSPSLSMGSTESIVGLFGQERLNPSDHKKPIKFKRIQPTIRTGDLALLYRRDQTTPHVAIFINHVETDPLFPLLLVKAKTKPLPLDKFEPQKPRFIHPITATTRIFYGDYEKVAIRYIQTDDDTQIDAEKAMNAINIVEQIPFSEKERAAITAATSDQERSLYTSTFMAAHYYRLLGIFKGQPDEVTPDNFVTELPLSDPLYVKLPSVKLGPMAHGDPPFLKQLVDGIYPAHAAQPLPYEEAIKGLDTGDLILFSGATSQGAIIKFFDHSQFSHVAMVLKAQYTSQLLIWEASTNHAKLVDVQAGMVGTGVEVLPLRNKVFSGWYDRVAIRHLMNITEEKRQEIYKTMLELRKEWMGRAYEKSFVQLALSAINPSDSFLSLFQNTQEDLSSLFCSELVAAAYQRMNLIKSDRPSNTYTPDDFSSARDSQILCEGVELSEEIYIELKWPSSVLSTQQSVY